MRGILAATLLLGLGACAGTGMDEAECRTADWRAIGYEDGAQGLRPEAFGARRRACAEHGVTAGFDAYLAGHGQGLELYCRPQNGYRLGSQGQRYAGVCPARLEGPFLAAHSDGYGLYERRAALDGIARQLSYNKQRSQEIEYLVVEKTASLVSPIMLPSERAAIAVELKQLAEEKAEVDRAIPRLERDYAEAERDYEAYRGQIANRY
ncbi:MAG: DUF2799 domain-containing protein [Rhodospirillales bacterium]|nr:DUF2799 domain-containing protein [Rhodospirillales bacterium]